MKNKLKAIIISVVSIIHILFISSTSYSDSYKKIERQKRIEERKKIEEIIRRQLYGVDDPRYKEFHGEYKGNQQNQQIQEREPYGEPYEIEEWIDENGNRVVIKRY